MLVVLALSDSGKAKDRWLTGASSFYMRAAALMSRLGTATFLI